MSDLIAHRGPDDQGLLFLKKDGVGLAHRRLAIIDTSAAGHQPMWDAARQVAIVFNGEIYNYRELKRMLEAAGRTFRNRTDTEVILNGYVEWGEGVLERLNGMFAFALWDSKRQSLLLARDGLGVKPLYFARSPSGLAFASELKCLLLVRDLDTSLDLESVYYHLAHLWCPSPGTMIKSIRKLEPGLSLWVQNGRIVSERRFYQLPPLDSPSASSAECTAHHLRQALSEAVRRQLVADVPVGAFLSGGLDSSAIVAMAREHRNQQPMKCFTISFDDRIPPSEGLVQDLPFARRVATHLKQDLVEVQVGPSLVDRLSEMILHLDEPQADPACLNVLVISEAARQHGIKVLLSGAGGDDLFTGYRRHRALFAERYWKWWPQPVRARLAHLSRLLPTSSPYTRRLRRALQFAGEEQHSRLASYFVWLDRQWLTRVLPWKDDVVPPDSLSPALEATAASLPSDSTALEQVLFLEMKHFLADHNLNYTDKMSMAAGVEVRVPFLDVDLVRFAASVPTRFKQRGSTGKWILRQSMHGVLPNDVIYRPKAGFGTPLRQWLRGPLQPLLRDLLSPASLRTRGLFRPSAVASLLESDRAGRIDAAYPIFALVCMELWLRVFVDERPPPTALARDRWQSPTAS